MPFGIDVFMLIHAHTHMHTYTQSLCVHYEMFTVSKIEVKNIFASAKSKYYNKKIKASRGNQRTVFSVVNKVRLSFQISSTQTKIWPIVLITSSVKIY